MQNFISALRRAVHCLAAVVIGTTAVSARVLPNIDAHSEAQVNVAAARTRIQQRAETIATAHLEERLGVPSFLALRPGMALLSTTAAKKLTAESAARAHLKSFADLYQLSPAEIDAAPLHHIEQLFNGAVLAKFTNQKDGIEIFRESATVLMKSPSEASAIGGSLGPTSNVTVISSSRLALFKLGPADAVASALGDYDFDASIAPRLVRAEQPPRVADLGAAGYQRFSLPPDATVSTLTRMSEPARTKPVWFRVAEGLVPAHYVELQMADAVTGSDDYYSYVIAADDGRILFRNNLTTNVAFTYKVWAEASGINLPLPGPQGRNATPHPTGLNDGYQAPFVPATQVTLQNGPISTLDPWLPPGATRTIGNNVEAWANHFAPPPPALDGFDANADECNMAAPIGADFHVCVSGANTFAYPYDLAAAPKASKTQSAAAVVNMFYTTNWLHDWYYDAGFREIDGNAQSDNYGRGGVGGDSLQAQAQDNSGVNNANMTTPADGGRPRMRMYVYTGNGGAIATVTPPGSNLQVGVARFGPSAFDVTAAVVAAVDGTAPTTDGCEAIINNVAGKIALIDRGNCLFKQKALNAQNAGAIGVIVVNNVPGVISMADNAALAATITVPALLVSDADGASLRSALQSGAVTARLQRLNAVDRDAALDNAIIAHEFGHLISNRLIGNANGLATVQAKGLGEGWSDFHALLMMVKEADAQVPANANFTGTYASSGYVEDGPQIPGVTMSNAYYYGDRRYPYSSNLSKNPLTFQHIQTTQSLPASPPPLFSGDNAEVHNTGEVWTSMLWGCYSSLLRDTSRLTFAQAQDRMKRYLIASYKLTPVNPTLIEARDALFAAIGAGDAADLAVCMAAFAQRGAGIGAVSGDRYAEDNRGVIESFATGNDIAITNMTFSVQAAASCNAGPYLNLGETGIVGITVKNTGGATLSGATVTLSGAGLAFPDGATLTLPTLAPSASASVTMTIRLAQQEAIGVKTILATLSYPSLATSGPRTANLQIFSSRDSLAGVAAQDDVEASTTLWITSLSGTTEAARLWTRTLATATNHVWHGPPGTTAGAAWLTSPPIQLAATGNLALSFSHRFAFDRVDPYFYIGGVVDISMDNGATWTDLGASLYTGTIADYAGSGNPLGNRPAFVGVSLNYPSFTTATIALPASFSGQTIRVRFGVGSDDRNGHNFSGWEVDDIAFSGAVSTPFTGYIPDALACIALSPAAGNQQSAVVGNVFTTPLQIRVMGADGRPVSGAMVNFITPVTGASATFAGGGNTASAITDINGYASTPTITANNVVGSYSVTASVGARSATFTLTNVEALRLLGVVSRKTHGTARTFDLPVTGPLTLEPRTIAGGHTIVFQFNNAISSIGTLTVADGANTVGASAVISGNNNTSIIVTIPTLADNKRVTISLANVNAMLTPAPVTMGFLVGDFNNSGSVNAADIVSLKARLPQPLSASNFMFDVNLSGDITAADISAAKARSGLVLP